MNSRPILERFWEKVKKTKACWNWIAAKSKLGYGEFRVDGKVVGAHRFSWELHNGKIADKMNVLHKCDNPSCINPEHLFLGSHRDNMRDRNKKNRQAKLKGESNGSSILTEKQVLEIRSRSKYYGNLKDLAKEFNVSQTMISYIINRKNWKHI